MFPVYIVICCSRMFEEMALVLDYQDSETVKSVRNNVFSKRLEVADVRCFIIFYDKYNQVFKINVICVTWLSISHKYPINLWLINENVIVFSAEKRVPVSR